RTSSTVEDGGDDHGIANDAIKNRIGREREYWSASDVAEHFGECIRRLGNHREHGPHLGEEANAYPRIVGVLSVPGRRVDEVALRGAAELVSHAECRRGRNFVRRRSMTISPSSSVPSSSPSRRSSSSAIHVERAPACASAASSSSISSGW